MLRKLFTFAIKYGKIIRAITFTSKENENFSGRKYAKQKK